MVDVPDFFPRSCTAVHLDGVGPSSAKGISRVERVGQLEVRHIVADIFSRLFQLFPLAFPHLHHRKPLGPKQVPPVLGEGVHIIHRSVQETKVGLPKDPVAGWTPAPETSLELVDGVGLGIEPVHSDAGV